MLIYLFLRNIEKKSLSLKFLSLMIIFRFTRFINPKFTRASASIAIDDIYEIVPISLSPPICPICDEFIDVNNKCKLEVIDGSCPLKLYNKNKEVIKNLVKKIKSNQNMKKED